ncbi:helix-turn-helix domain-containing protein [Haladaptatus halobius]|uniref:helix-turn-helix domain-containing protein n=1 Tax=Haladaptatus halobius TaxID=2884875 RepID=UPI001D0ADE78|nr:helix-turn-helix domain-containing protein [Haladaptatus halobius]
MIPVNATHPTHSIGTVCDLLANRHRRVVLDHLQDGDSDAVTLTELAAVIQTQVDDVESEQQARTILIHNHLPKLADYDIIEYDQRSETVRFCDGIQNELLFELGGFYK